MQGSSSRYQVSASDRNKIRLLCYHRKSLVNRNKKRPVLAEMGSPTLQSPSWYKTWSTFKPKLSTAILKFRSQTLLSTWATQWMIGRCRKRVWLKKMLHYRHKKVFLPLKSKWVTSGSPAKRIRPKRHLYFRRTTFSLQERHWLRRQGRQILKTHQLIDLSPKIIQAFGLSTLIHSHLPILLFRQAKKWRLILLITETPFKLRMSFSTMMRASPLLVFTCKASPFARDQGLGNLTLVASRVKFLPFHITRMPKLMDLNYTEARLLMRRDREANFISLR